jgi:hypothetical protein
MKLQSCAAFLLLSLTPPAVWAQSTNATITGTVTDEGGGRVTNVTVSARHVATNIVYNGTVSNDGTYVIPDVPVGEFEVSARAPGFRPFVHSGVTLEVAQRLRLDIRLQVGAVNDAVTVTAEIPKVQTEESDLGHTVDRTRIEQLPIDGRIIFDLVRIVPGVQPVAGATDGFGDTRNLSISQVSFNGGPVFGNQILLDGGANVSAYEAELAVSPIADTVEEFRVETNALKAEYGQSNGGITSMVTKSGTNQLHGSAYAFVRNDILDARNAFATQVNPLTGKIKPIDRFNQFGGTFGGPVILPKLYNGRNRTFFFVGGEKWHYNTSALQVSTVPTALEHAGDFSNSRGSNGNLIPIYDPATTMQNPAGAGYVRTLFPGNIVPASRIDPVAKNIAPFMPFPNATPSNPFTNSNNFSSAPPNPTDVWSANVRIDHHFSEKDILMGRYSATFGQVVGLGYGLGPADGAALARTDSRNNANGLVSETHVFSPTLMNELRLNVTRATLSFVHPSTGGGWPQKLGMPSIIPNLYFPRIEVSGLLPLGGTSYTTGARSNTLMQVADTVTLICGRHQIKFGTDQRWQQINWINSGFASGQFQFTGGLTGNPLSPAGTGVAWADFLLGQVGGGQLNIVPAFAFKYTSNGSFVQDDFKVSKNLTLNLGLRWDVNGAPVERFNQYSNFDPSLRNPQTGLPGVLRYAGQDIPSQFTKRQWNQWGPRAGFAWNVTGDGKTAVRGGFGLLYIMTGPADANSDYSNSLGFSANTAFQSTISGVFPAFALSQGPSSILQPLGASGGPSAYRGQTVYFEQYDTAPAYVEQWNLTVEREIVHDWTASVTYAGNHGVHLFGGNYNMDQLNPSYLSLGLALQNLVPNPFYGQIATGPLAAATISRQQSLLPFPDYLSVLTLANRDIDSTYHSLQVNVRKRFSKGFTLLLAFTASKLLDDGASSLGIQGNGTSGFRLGAYNQALDRAVDVNDVSRRFVGSGVYELPFGKGKRWLSSMPAIPNAILGGWQLNSVTTVQTGVPLVVTGANNFSGINVPDLVADPTLPGDQRSVAGWFNVNAFRNPAPFTVGNAPRTLPSTRGPGIFTMDLSLFKTFVMRDRFRLEMRGEAFNSLNWVNLGTPNTTFSPNAQGVNANGAFGHITSAGNARSIQLGMRLAF